MATPPVFLPGEPHGQRSLVGHKRVRHDLATERIPRCAGSASSLEQGPLRQALCMIMVTKATTKRQAKETVFNTESELASSLQQNCKLTSFKHRGEFNTLPSALAAAGQGQVRIVGVFLQFLKPTLINHVTLRFLKPEFLHL